MMKKDDYYLGRLLEVQEVVFPVALKELQQGRA